MTDIQTKLTFNLTSTEQLVDLVGRLSGTPASTGGVAAPPVVDYFPADPGSAPFPSPENSSSIVLNGKISGAPYVRSMNGAIYQILPDKVITNQYGTGYGMSVNGEFFDPNTFVTQIVVRQHAVYFAFNNAGYGIFEAPDGVMSGVARVPLPPPFVSSGTSASGETIAVPDMPPDPPAPAVAVGGSGNVISFGAGTQHPTIESAIAEAKAGDSVVYAATAPRGVVFPESVSVPEGVRLDLGGRWKDLGLVAAAFAKEDWAALDALYVPGAIADGKTLADPDGYAHQNGCFVYMGNGRVDGARILNFGTQEPKHGGTAALRAYGSCVGTISGSQNYITDCQNGVGPGGTSINTNFSETVILRCGLNDGAGGAHCVYDSSVTVRSSYGPNFFSYGSPMSGSGGHALKSRAKVLTLIAPFHLKGNDSSALDRPDGSTLVDQIGAGIIEQCAGAGNHNVIGYGPESMANGVVGEKYSGTTIIGNCDSPGMIALGPVVFDSTCKFLGNKITVPPTVKGAPA